MPQVAVTMTSQDAQLWAGMQKLIAQQTKMEKGFGKVGRSARGAGRQSKRAFGANAVSQLTKYAVGFVGIHKAIGVTTKALTDMQEVRREAARELHASAAGMGQLAQLAESPEEMKQLVAQAKGIYRAGGATDKDQAARTLFALKSAGAEEFVSLFTELKRKDLVAQPDIMARASKALMSSLGKEETGTFRDLISKAFGASKTTPATAEALLAAAARPGAFAKPLGLSDEEILSMVAVLSRQASGEDPAGKAGTWVRSLLKGLGEAEQFKDMSVVEILKDISGRKLDTKGLKGVIGGRSEAKIAYQGLLDNLKDFQEVLADVHLAQKEDRVSKKLGYADVIPELRAVRQAREAKAGRVLAETDLGTANLYADAIQEQVQKSMIDTGYPQFFRWMVGTMMRGHRLVGGDKDLINVFARQQGTSELSQDIQGFQAAKTLERAAAKLEKAIDRMRGAPTLSRPDDDPGARRRE